MNRCLLSCVLIILLNITNGFSQYRGKVSEVNTKKGIQGVVVSDGVSSVKTDAKGDYELPANDSVKFVTVVTPSGYTYTDSFYKRIGETNDFNFAVRKVANEPLRFIHISDTETYVYKSWLDDMKSFIKNEPTSFVVLSGDICYEKGLKFHVNTFTTEELGCRAVPTLGNHDLVGENYSGEKLFEEMFGPVWYSFDVGGVHFVVTPMAGGDRWPGYTQDKFIKWFKGDLDQVSKDTPIVVFNHDIVFYDGDFTYKTDKNILSLNDYNLKGWFYGHWHVNHFKEFKNGVKAYGTSAPDKGGIDHSPSSFRVIDFDSKGELNSELRYTSVKNSVVSNLAMNSVLNVNAYSSGASTNSVTAKVGAKSYPLVKNSGWRWSVKLPEGVSEKEITVETQFTDAKLQSYVGLNASGLAPFVEWSVNYVDGGSTYMSAPVDGGDKVFYAVTDDDKSENCGLIAVDKSTGKLLWKFKSDFSIKNNFVFDGNSVYAADLGGVLYAVNGNTGECVRRLELHDYILPTHNLGITLDKGVIYAGHAKSLSAIEASTFKVLWKNSEWGGGEGTVLSIVVENGILHTGGYWNGRYTHDARTGKLLWKTSANGTTYSEASATPYKDLLYYLSPTHLFEADPMTGEVMRSAKSAHMLGTASKPIVTEDLIIVGTTDKGVAAYRRKTLLPVWTFRTKPAMVYTAAYSQDYEQTVEGSVTLVGDKLYFGASDGCLYAIDCSTGSFIWSISLGAPILSSVAVSDGSLFVNDLGGTLYKLKL